MGYMPSNETIKYLTSWLVKAATYQEKKGRKVDLSVSDFMQLWGDKRLKKLDEWIVKGMGDGRMHISNPYAFVLTWNDRDAVRGGVMNIHTAKVSTRIESQLNNRFTKGDKHTEEAKVRIGDAKRGKKQSEDHRCKRSEAQKGVKRGPMSEAHKAAIRAAKAAKKVAA